MHALLGFGKGGSWLVYVPWLLRKASNALPDKATSWMTEPSSMYSGPESFAA
jgi:hypothetical protein